MRERDPWFHEDRSGRGRAENLRGESKAEHSGGEKVKFSEIMGVFGYKDNGNWNNKTGITGLIFSGDVKQFFNTRISLYYFTKKINVIY